MKTIIILITTFLSFNLFAVENTPEVINEENLNVLKYDGYRDESDITVKKKIQYPVRILNLKQVHDEVLKKKEPEATPAETTDKQSSNTETTN